MSKPADFYVKEYLKCKKSFKYYCETYLNLNVAGGDQKFILYDRQNELVDYIDENKYVIILKSRQTGISTVLQAKIAHMMLFFPNSSVGVISKSGDLATTFLRFVKGFIDATANFLKPVGGKAGRGYEKRSEQSCILMNKSRCLSATVSPVEPESCLRGEALNFLIIDEAAYVRKLEKSMVSIIPGLSTAQAAARRAGSPYGTVIVSTPSISGKYFTKLWHSALTGDDIFKPFIVHYSQIPQLRDDPLWLQNQKRMFGDDQRKIQQELELKFLPSEGSFFEPETIEKVQASTIDPIEIIKLYNGSLWIFEKPIPGETYISGYDTASDHGSDNSAAVIFSASDMRQVAEYSGKLPVKDFIRIVKYLCSEYPGCIVAECDGINNQLIEEVRETHAHMMYKSKRGNSNVMQPGLSNNAKTRPLILDSLFSYVTQFPNCVRSSRLALELATLVQKPNGRAESEEGMRDDLALAAAFCFYVRKYDVRQLSLSGIEVNQDIQHDLNDIINFNTSSQIPTNNSSILHHIKQEQTNNPHNRDTQGFIDILNFYQRD